MRLSQRIVIPAVLTFLTIASSLIPLQSAVADDSPPLIGLYISRSYEHLPEYQGNNNVYLEWTLWNESSYWDEHEISGVECQSTSGNCTSKGWYTPNGVPLQGEIRVDSLTDDSSVDISLSVIVKLKTNPSETETFTIVHSYKSLQPEFTYQINSEFVGGGSIDIDVSAPLEIETRQYKTWFSCASASGANCWVSGSYNLESLHWTGSVQLANYVQGQDIELVINRHWATAITDFAVDGTYGSTVKKISISTLLPGIAPQIGVVTSEADGCSFDILNYDPLFDYFFKKNDSEVNISDSGRVRLSGQLPGTTLYEYPSSRRAGYTIINNVSEEFQCTSLISEDMKRALREAEARESYARNVEKASNQIMISITSGNPLTVNQLLSADLNGVTAKNIEGINSEIAKLDSGKKSDLNEIKRIVKRFAIVDKISEMGTFYITDLIDTGLVDRGISNRSSIMRGLKEMPSELIDTFEEIQIAIQQIQAKIIARKTLITSIVEKYRKRL